MPLTELLAYIVVGIVGVGIWILAGIIAWLFFEKCMRSIDVSDRP